MIYGIGIDNIELSRIKRALERSGTFAAKVLTDSEFEQFRRQITAKRRIEFLGGIWAAKEAYSKAYGTGYNGELHIKDMEIAHDPKGKPYFAKHPFKGTAQLSITHSNLEAQAIVTLENALGN